MLPAALPMQGRHLRQFFRQLNARQAEFPGGVVQDLLESIPILLSWTRAKHPTQAVQRVMIKQARTVGHVQRTIHKLKRPAGGIAEAWDALLVSKATELLNGSVDKHAHWFTLENAPTGCKSSAE